MYLHVETEMTVCSSGRRDGAGRQTDKAQVRQQRHKAAILTEADFLSELNRQTLRLST